MQKSELDSDDDDDPHDPTPAPPSEAHQPGKESGGGPDITSPAAVTNIIKESGGQILFFQLPDKIPVEQTSNSLGESAATTNGDNGGQVNTDDDSSLTGMEGRLGELQIRKDGSCQLVIGQQRFDMEVGTQVGFLQVRTHTRYFFLMVEIILMYLTALFLLLIRKIVRCAENEKNH